MAQKPATPAWNENHRPATLAVNPSESRRIDVAKGQDPPIGNQELYRSRQMLGISEQSPDGIDSKRLTGGADRSLQTTEYPTGNENPDFEMGIDQMNSRKVVHNHNRPAIGIGPHSKPNGQRQSMYTRPANESDSLANPDASIDVEGNNQAINDAGKIDIDKEEDDIETEKAANLDNGEATIDVSDSPQSQNPVESPNETPNDPRDFLSHVSPIIQQTSGKTTASVPSRTGLQWGDWPTK